MNTRRLIAAGAATLVLGAGVAACGDDDEDTTASDATTEETASAEEVTVTTADVTDGYSWEVEPTNPTTETKEITFVNDSAEDHGFVFARINEGFTLEEAFELQGRKGSAENYIEAGAAAGETQTFPVEDVTPGDYVLLCPIPGHLEQGQVEEFEIS